MRFALWIFVLLLSALHAQTINAVAVGHEFRQDDAPSIAACPDGGVWVSWLSFGGDRDDVVIRHYKNQKWSSLQWVPGSSGDSWLPQVGCDAGNNVWVVWSQQAASNWDIYARKFDPAKQEWDRLQRLTTDPLPDINPRMTADGKGRLAVAWQGFREGRSNIFARIFDGVAWSPDIRVTTTAANDWEPAPAFDAAGNVWVAYDSYRNGNYDIFLNKIANGKAEGAEIAVAASPLFEARATIAVDGNNRIWVAWEEGAANWGKDQGYTVRDVQTAVPLGGARKPRLRCYTAGQWKTTAADLASAFPNGNTSQPHVLADGLGSIWIAAKTHVTGGAVQRGFWEYRLTHFDGAGWSPSVAIPDSKGRSSTRMSGVALGDGTLMLAWPTDNRAPGFYHRPLRQRFSPPP